MPHLEFPPWSWYRCEWDQVWSLLIAARLHKAKSCKSSVDLQNHGSRSDWLFFSLFYHTALGFPWNAQCAPLPSCRLEAALGLLGTTRVVTLQSYIRIFFDPICVAWKPQRLMMPSQLNTRFAEWTYLLLCLAQVFVDNQESLKPWEEVKPRREGGRWIYREAKMVGVEICVN